MIKPNLNMVLSMSDNSALKPLKDTLLIICLFFLKYSYCFAQKQVRNRLNTRIEVPFIQDDNRNIDIQPRIKIFVFQICIEKLFQFKQHIKFIFLDQLLRNIEVYNLNIFLCIILRSCLIFCLLGIHVYF